MCVYIYIIYLFKKSKYKRNYVIKINIIYLGSSFLLYFNEKAQTALPNDRPNTGPKRNFALWPAKP